MPSRSPKNDLSANENEWKCLDLPNCEIVKMENDSMSECVCAGAEEHEVGERGKN